MCLLNLPTVLHPPTKTTATPPALLSNDSKQQAASPEGLGVKVDGAVRLVAHAVGHNLLHVLHNLGNVLAAQRGGEGVQIDDCALPCLSTSPSTQQQAGRQVSLSALCLPLPQPYLTRVSTVGRRQPRAARSSRNSASYLQQLDSETY